MDQNKWLRWLKWFLIMGATLVLSYVTTVLIIFGVIFEDVEHNARKTCNHFNLGIGWKDTIKISEENGFEASIDKEKTMVSFFYDGGFLTIAGCELYFENKILAEKKVWVD